MFDRKPLECEPLVKSPPGTRPDKWRLLHYIDANFRKFGHAAAYIDLLVNDRDAAQKKLLDVPLVQAEEQDRSEFENLYAGLRSWLNGDVKYLAYLVPDRCGMAPFNYPVIRGFKESGVRYFVFEQITHDIKNNSGFYKLNEFGFIRYPSQSQKAFDNLLKLVMAENKKHSKSPELPVDNRPDQWVDRNPRAPEPAPKIA